MCHQDLFSFLGIGIEMEERPQLVVCYSSGDETSALDEEWRSEDHLPGSLAPFAVLNEVKS